MDTQLRPPKAGPSPLETLPSLDEALPSPTWLGRETKKLLLILESYSYCDPRYPVAMAWTAAIADLIGTNQKQANRLITKLGSLWHFAKLQNIPHTMLAKSSHQILNKIQGVTAQPLRHLRAFRQLLETNEGTAFLISSIENTPHCPHEARMSVWSKKGDDRIKKCFTGVKQELTLALGTAPDDVAPILKVFQKRLLSQKRPTDLSTKELCAARTQQWLVMNSSLMYRINLLRQTMLNASFASSPNLIAFGPETAVQTMTYFAPHLLRDPEAIMKYYIAKAFTQEQLLFCLRVQSEFGKIFFDWKESGLENLLVPEPDVLAHTRLEHALYAFMQKTIEPAKEALDALFATISSEEGHEPFLDEVSDFYLTAECLWICFFLKLPEPHVEKTGIHLSGRDLKTRHFIKLLKAMGYQWIDQKEGTLSHAKTGQVLRLPSEALRDEVPLQLAIRVLRKAATLESQ